MTHVCRTSKSQCFPSIMGDQEIKSKSSGWQQAPIHAEPLCWLKTEMQHNKNKIFAIPRNTVNLSLELSL